MILSDKDLMLLHSMPTSSEPDSSGSQGDLKIGTDYNCFNYKYTCIHPNKQET